MGEKRDAYRLLVRKPGGRRPLEIPRLVWVGNIKMHLKEISLAQDRNKGGERERERERELL
jgi:hypothetical protein